ncbi:MAG: hypothetical protein JWN48_1745 [Myxococcaceae bacterium]|nr:hypothetical protein [Myxococcaceae bacterium]
MSSPSVPLEARTATGRAWRALPFTFLLYVFEAALATLFALPLGLEATRKLLGSSWDRTQVALALDGLVDLAPALRVGLGSGLLALSLLGLLSPWLQMSWYAALADSRTPLRALSDGARLLLRAWWVTLFVALAWLLAAAPFLGLAYALHDGLRGATDARFHDLAVLAALAPLLPLLLLALLLHDLARARALRFGALASVLCALRVALRPSVQLRSLGLTLLGYGAVWLAEALSSAAFSIALTVMLLQSALLARLFLRSLWLATALTCMHPELETGARQV